MCLSVLGSFPIENIKLRLCQMRVPEYYVKTKNYLRRENKVNKNKVL